MVKRGHVVKSVILSIAIALISVFFFVYAIQAIYPGPLSEDYCNYNRPVTMVETRSSCEALNGTWNEYPKPESNVTGYCDYYTKCQDNYQNVREPYERNVFFANLIIGIVLVVTGIFLALPSVSSGLMGGGVIMLVYGTIRNWGNLSDTLRTIMLGIALIILIWLGYKKLNK